MNDTTFLFFNCYFIILGLMAETRISSDRNTSTSNRKESTGFALIAGDFETAPTSRTTLGRIIIMLCLMLNNVKSETVLPTSL